MSRANLLRVRRVLLRSYSVLWRVGGLERLIAVAVRDNFQALSESGNPTLETSTPLGDPNKVKA